MCPISSNIASCGRCSQSWYLVCYTNRHSRLVLMLISLSFIPLSHIVLCYAYVEFAIFYSVSGNDTCSCMIQMR